MKIKYILIIFTLILSLSLVSSAMNPAPPYCERMGYTLSEDETNCEFGDGTSCNLGEFYIGVCGEEHVKELPCVPLGEPVFTNEECCDGIPDSFPRKFGQSSCQPTTQVIFGIMGYYSTYIIGIVILIVIGYIIYKLIKKKQLPL